MSEGSARSHFSQAFHWADVEHFKPDMLAAALAMGVPVVLGVALDKAQLGYAAALGGLALATVAAPSFQAQAVRLGLVLAAVVAAAVVAALAHGHSAAIVAFAALAALAGGYSRRAAEATMRFTLLVVIIASALGQATGGGDFGPAIAAGGLWSALVSLALGFFARTPAPDPAPEPSARLKRARLAQRLKTIDGWLYCLRLTLCLGIGYGLDALWPGRHFYWVSVTVVLLLERRVERFPLRTTQRAIGVALGVCLAALLPAFEPPPLLTAGFVVLLAGLRPALRARNYIAYSVVMTPLILLLLDAGAAPGARLLFDRLVATLIAAALVLAVNRVAEAAQRDG